MTWEKIPCRFCGMTFENTTDCIEHERCHVPVIKTAPNSHPKDGGPIEIVWEESPIYSSLPNPAAADNPS